MRLFFVSDILYTTTTVIGSINKIYDQALIDTGAFKTGLPLEDCKELKLMFAGTHSTAGLYGEDILPLFYCQFDFGDNDLHMLQILGLPLNQAIIGRDILSNYRFTIDWIQKSAVAERGV